MFCCGTGTGTGQAPRGRPRHTRVFFCDEHPQCETKMIMRAQTFAVPKLSYIPRQPEATLEHSTCSTDVNASGNDTLSNNDEERDNYARFVLSVFAPISASSISVFSPSEQYATWWDVYENFIEGLHKENLAFWQAKKGTSVDQNDIPPPWQVCILNPNPLMRWLHKYHWSNH